MNDPAPVDGFLYSASMLYLPTTYRASVLAQMEILRKARGYRARWYLVPEDVNQPVSAFGQVEYQVRVQPGSYFWAVSFSAPFLGETPLQAFVNITDACTETPFFSDYLNANTVVPSTGASRRNPSILTPGVVGEPGLLDVEVYNSSSEALQCQLMLLLAEPCVPGEDIKRALQEAGLEHVLA